MAITKRNTGYTPLQLPLTGSKANTLKNDALTRSSFSQLNSQIQPNNSIAPLDLSYGARPNQIGQQAQFQVQGDVAAPKETLWGNLTSESDDDTSVLDNNPKMSNWDIASKGLTAIGSLGTGYAAVKGIGIAEDANRDARATTNANLDTQANILAVQLRNREYVRLKAMGKSAADADEGSKQSVENMNLQTNLNGDSFKWS